MAHQRRRANVRHRHDHFFSHVQETPSGVASDWWARFGVTLDHRDTGVFMVAQYPEVRSMGRKVKNRLVRVMKWGRFGAPSISGLRGQQIPLGQCS